MSGEYSASCKSAPTFISVPWCRDGVYTWSYADEEEIVRRPIEVTTEQHEALLIFLRHYFTASMLCGMSDTCRRVGDRILSLMPTTSLEKCWAQSLVGIIYVHDTVKNFAQASDFTLDSDSGGRLERGNMLQIAPYEAWALQQAYEFFCQDIIPWFVINDGYPFCDHSDLLLQIRPLETFRTEWNWLSDPFSGYLRIVYNSSPQLFG